MICAVEPSELDCMGNIQHRKPSASAVIGFYTSFSWNHTGISSKSSSESSSESPRNHHWNRHRNHHPNHPGIIIEIVIRIRLVRLESRRDHIGITPESPRWNHIGIIIWIVIGIIIGVLIIILLFFCLFRCEMSNVDSEGISVSRMSAMSTMFV